MAHSTYLPSPFAALGTLERAEVFLRTKTLTDPKGLYTIVSTTYTAAMEDLLTGMRTLESTLATGDETALVRITELSELHQRIHLAYRKVCNLISTEAPEFTIPEKEKAASSRRLFEIDRSSALSKYLEKNGIDIATTEFREIWGDGNCFYYSTAAYLIDTGFIDHMREVFTTITLPSAHTEALGRFLDTAEKEPEAAIADTHGMKVFVRALRELTASHIAKNIAEYADTLSTTLAMEFPDDASILTQMTGESSDAHVKRLINSYVREMGKDASVSCITALAKTLKLPINIHDPLHQPKPLGINTDTESLLPKLNIVKTGEHYYLLYLASTPRAATAAAVADISRIERPFSRLQVYYCGTEKLFIRGESGYVKSSEDAPCAGAGAGAARHTQQTELRWDRGVALTHIEGKHLWEIEITPGSEYKICLDDSVFSEGDNLKAAAAELSPIFPVFGEASILVVKGDAGDRNHFAICGEGRVRLGEKIFDLSWDPKVAVALSRFDTAIWGKQIEVLSRVSFKVVKIKADKSADWEKSDNRELPPLSALSITPIF